MRYLPIRSQLQVIRSITVVGASISRETEKMALLSEEIRGPVNHSTNCQSAAVTAAAESLLIQLEEFFRLFVAQARKVGEPTYSEQTAS